jgi:hypothetical protein
MSLDRMDPRPGVVIDLTCAVGSRYDREDTI